MNREQAKQMMEQVKSLDWAAFEKAMGVKVHFGGTIFDPTEGGGCHFKITVTPTVLNGVAVDQDRLNFEKYAGMFGLKPEHFGKEIVYGGKRLKISGFNPRAHKRNLILSDETGKQFVCDPNDARLRIKLGIKVGLVY